MNDIMTEYIVTTADNGYIVESEEPAMRLVAAMSCRCG